jgi:hypothetical protein
MSLPETAYTIRPISEFGTPRKCGFCGESAIYYRFLHNSNSEIDNSTKFPVCAACQDREYGNV